MKKTSLMIKNGKVLTKENQKVILGGVDCGCTGNTNGNAGQNGGPRCHEC